MDLLDNFLEKSMPIPVSTRLAACEGLFHFVPKKTLAKTLGVSSGSIRDWAIYIEHGYFDWIDHPWQRREAMLHKAIDYWFDNYPIGYTDVARQFGVRPATLFASIQRKLATLPEIIRPKRLLFWESVPVHSLGKSRMPFEKPSDIPIDRPLTPKERKELMRELKDARDRLICAQAILEVALESTKDELKKKELRRVLEQVNDQLASYNFAD